MKYEYEGKEKHREMNEMIDLYYIRCQCFKKKKKKKIKLDQRVEVKQNREKGKQWKGLMCVCFFCLKKINFQYEISHWKFTCTLYTSELCIFSLSFVKYTIEFFFTFILFVYGFDISPPKISKKKMVYKIF